jgi:hypothetical protein
MSKSTNENDSSSCEPEANSDITCSESKDVYLDPLVTKYDVGMVVEGPPPLQACNSCRHFETVLACSKDKYYGTCHNNLQILDKSLVSEDLNATCWNFCLREDLLKLKIKRLRSQNANRSNKLHE